MNTNQKSKFNNVIENSIIMKDRINIQKRINFLQKCILNMTQYNKSNEELLEESRVFKNLNDSLQLTQKLLEINQRLQNTSRYIY